MLITTVLAVTLSAQAGDATAETRVKVSEVEATRRQRLRGWSGVGFFGHAGETWELPTCNASWVEVSLEYLNERPAVFLNAKKGTRLPATVQCTGEQGNYDWTVVARSSVSDAP